MNKSDQTRMLILQKAFGLMYKNGYQGTSIHDIIATTTVSKGAFFYHFKSKDEMALAMIHDVLYPGMYNGMIKPLNNVTHPVNGIYANMEQVLLGEDFFITEYGCPAVNLIDEMAPLNSAIKKALLNLMNEWQHALEACLLKGIESKTIRDNVQPKQTALFIISGYAGIRNMGKLTGKACYHDYLHELKTYLENLLVKN